MPFNKNNASIFDALLEIRWFHRVWTLQEVALAKEALVVLGEITMPWTTLRLAVDALRDAELRLTDSPLGVAAMSVLVSSHAGISDAISPVQVVRESAKRRGWATVTSIIASALLKKSSDPRDCVFGVHAMLQARGAQPQEPDYRKPVDQVFTEATRLAIEHDQSLAILYYVHGVDLKEHWPSWVPTRVDSLVGHRTIPFFTLCRAAGPDSPPVFKFLNDGRQLAIQGIKVGTVLMFSKRSPCLGSPYRAENHGIERYLDHCRDVQGIIQSFQTWIVMWNTARRQGLLTSAYGDMSGVTGALFVALLGGEPRRMDKIPALVTGFNKWLTILCANLPGSIMGMDGIVAMLPATSPHETWLPTDMLHLMTTEEWKIYEAIENDPDVLFFHQKVMVASPSRTLFVSDSGHVGTAPASIKAGDEIVLVSGFQYPILVRADEEAEVYRMLGTAYVPGMMEGQFWPKDGEGLSEYVLA